MHYVNIRMPRLFYKKKMDRNKDKKTFSKNVNRCRDVNCNINFITRAMNTIGMEGNSSTIDQCNCAACCNM